MKYLPKHMILLILFWIPGLMLLAREGVTLYSVGNNSPWNGSGSWSRTSSGIASGLIPQSDDTLIIISSVILNQDFLLGNNGRIEVTSQGWLRGASFCLTLSGSSLLSNSGTIQLSKLNLTGNASLLVGSKGKTEVSNEFIQLTSSTSLIDGKLLVNGILTCGDNLTSGTSLTGTGIISGNSFNGTGQVMGIQPSGSIPDHSTLTSISWTGASDAEWNNPSNWSGEIVPTSSDNVSILMTGHQPVINDAAFCNNLYLSQGTSLTIIPGALLRIESDLIVPNTSLLQLDNSSGQFASLIVNGTIQGKIKSSIQVKQNQPALVSSPVIDAESEVFINMYLRSYNESSSAWGNYIVPTNTPLSTMKGYELQSPYAATRYFEGTPPTGELTIPISSDNEGWNLVGNPFPCYLDWQNTGATGQGWDRSNVAEAIYYLDPNGSGNYSVYLAGNDEIGLNSGNRYIAPMQGFFVKARKQGQNSILKVNNLAVAAITEHSNSILPANAIRFHVDSEGYSDETVLRINPESSFDYDDDFDAYKLPGLEQAPTLFTEVSDGSRLSINTLPALTSSLEIPLGITSTQPANFTLRIQGGAAFEYRYPLTLEDKVTKTYYNLRSDSVFTFSYSPDDDPMRFVLRFETAAGFEDGISAMPVVTMKQGMIRIEGLTGQNNHIEVISLDGKQVLVNTSNSSNDCSFPFTGSPGIYVVKITTKTASHVYKLYAE